MLPHIALIPSPVGLLAVSASERGLLSLEWVSSARQSLPTGRFSHELLAEAGRQLGDYFAGRRGSFDLPLDHPVGSAFKLAVLRATLAIPPGRTLSYSELAAQAGSPGAARAAGSVMSRNPLPILIPCHRVLPAGGSPGRYGGGKWRKLVLLEHEARHWPRS